MSSIKGKHEESTVGMTVLEFPQDDDAEYAPVTTRSGLRSETNTPNTPVLSLCDEERGSITRPRPRKRRSKTERQQKEEAIDPVQGRSESAVPRENMIIDSRE